MGTYYDIFGIFANNFDRKGLHPFDVYTKVRPKFTYQEVVKKDTNTSP